MLSGIDLPHSDVHTGLCSNLQTLDDVMIRDYASVSSHDMQRLNSKSVCGGSRT